MQDYSAIQFHLDVAQERLAMGKVIDSLEELTLAFFRTRELEGSRFRTYCTQIWNAVDDIRIMNAGGIAGQIQVHLLHGQIESEVIDRGEDIAFPSLNTV